MDPDIVTTLSAIPGLGHYFALIVPWLTLIIAVAAVTARFFPPPARSTGVYAALYFLVNWAAQNRGHAANANAPAETKPPVLTLGPIAFLLATCVVLSSCATAPSPSVTPPASPPVTATAAAAAAVPSLLDLANALNPKATAAVNNACPIATNVISAVGSCLSGGAAGSTGALAQIDSIVAPSCTEAGKLQLVVNDTSAASTGPSASNSGDSAAFILAMSQKAAALAPVACPIAKALLKAS